MAVVADLDMLVSEGVLTPSQAATIRARSRGAMISLAVNVLLAGGVLAAAAGFVVLLADTMSVAGAGLGFLALGILVLTQATATWRMFGHAAALIGAGMLIGGGVIECLDRLTPGNAGIVLVIAGAALGIAAFAVFRWRVSGLAFIAGFLALGGAALHLAGLYMVAYVHDIPGILIMLVSLYAAALVAALGWQLDVRLVTALAIVPFAQVLSTSTAYFHAAYVFYSPEPTLSILQMAAALALCLWIMAQRPERDGRHAGIFAMMAFVVGNLCFLVGSLWGDTVGDTFLRDWLEARHPNDWEAVWVGQDMFRARALSISAGVFSVIWAVLLVACAIWAAHTLRRGLFNAAITFGAIHGYTQAFESFGDQPLAWIIGGLAAIPLAWMVWRLNQQFG